VGPNPAPIQDLTEEEFDRVLDINLRGVFLTTRAVVPHLITQKSGRIINVSSIVGQTGFAMIVPYAASKFAVIGVTQCLAHELAPYGITANNVCPGIVETALHSRVVEQFSAMQGQTVEEGWDYFRNRIPLHRFQTPRDLGEMVAFLASDRAQNITGATFNVDGGWEINGRKWFATGAEGSAFAIAMVITDPSVPAHKGVTMFLVPTDAPGFRLIRSVPTMGGHGGPGGHGEIDFDRVRVPDSAILGQLGEGFKMAQVRLTPARLTHCMRWTGVAQRSLEIAAAYAKERDAFGKKLSEHQSIQWMIADSEIELHASRLMVMQAAWKHERGDDIRHESSICKVFVAEAVNRVIDRAVQICGALGISTDTPLEHFYREARAFRIYDGPSEVHRMVIARNVLRSRG